MYNLSTNFKPYIFFRSTSIRTEGKSSAAAACCLTFSCLLRHNAAMIPTSHEYYMQQALREAEKAEAQGEVPVGCVIVLENHIIGRGYNQREMLQDPTAHAEMIAITAAAEHHGSWRLEKARLYVTLEPCPMCAGAIILSRIAEVYFGAYDPKAGCCGSLMNLLEDTRFNHRPAVIGGLCEEACGTVLSNFFRNIRDRQKFGKERASDN
jgi:tRNA(adenine34) deaminase